MILDKSYWWNADRTRIVPDGHPDAAFLWLAKGHEVADMVARGYGILKDEPEPVTEAAEADPDGETGGDGGEGSAGGDDAAEAKAKEAPANKAKATAANKAK